MAAVVVGLALVLQLTLSAVLAAVSVLKVPPPPPQALMAAVVVGLAVLHPASLL